MQRHTSLATEARDGVLVSVRCQWSQQHNTQQAAGPRQSTLAKRMRLSLTGETLLAEVRAAQTKTSKIVTAKSGRVSGR
jgi:hypothetical protein